MILYFTGTGNSKYVASEMARLLEDETVDLNARIKQKDHSPISSERPWVLAVPTYAWQIPHVVCEWMMKTPLTGSDKLYVIMTCGDGIGNAAAYAEKLCRSKGLVLCGCEKVAMPENYIAMFDAPDAETARTIVAAAEARLAPLADRIKNGDRFDERKVSLLDKIYSGPINTVFYKFFIKDKQFYASDACTSCGLCEKACPMGNIKINDGRPVWQGDCTHCMACICRCPAEAIEYGNKSKGKIRYTFRG